MGRLGHSYNLVSPIRAIEGATYCAYYMQLGGLVSRLVGGGGCRGKNGLERGGVGVGGGGVINPE